MIQQANWAKKVMSSPKGFMFNHCKGKSRMTKLIYLIEAEGE